MGNCEELISRQVAVDAIGKLSDEIYRTVEKGATFPTREWFDGMAQAEHIVKNLPSVQPKTGKWLRTDAYPHRIYCSACYATYVPNDEWASWKNYILPRKFCPNCGVPMEEEENE